MCIATEDTARVLAEQERDRLEENRQKQRVAEQAKAEEALRESTTLLRAIVETAVDAIITIDEKGIITSFNPAAIRLFGYTPDEVLGQNIKRLMPAPFHEEHDGYLEQLSQHMR